MKKTILFVDDEPDLQEICIDYLTLKGYEVHLFCDANEAISQYLTIKPDLVILDVNMPEQSGFLTAKIIRSKDPNIPILFLSGTSGHENAVKGLEIGANDYIRKDIHLEELCARIKKELDKKFIRPGDKLRLTPETYIDIYAKSLISYGVIYKFSDTEFQILLEISNNINALFDRKNIISKILRERIGADDYLSKTLTKIRAAIKNDKSIKLEAISGSISLQVVNEC